LAVFFLMREASKLLCLRLGREEVEYIFENVII
jgi:hypothetical protein